MPQGVRKNKEKGGKIEKKTNINIPIFFSRKVKKKKKKTARKFPTSGLVPTVCFSVGEKRERKKAKQKKQENFSVQGLVLIDSLRPEACSPDFDINCIAST